MGLVSFLVLPLFFIYGFKFDEVIFTFLILSLEIFISGIISRSSIIDILIFLRIVIFSLLIYQVVKLYLTPKTIIRVIKVMIIISVIQLPFILLERIVYQYLPISVSNLVNLIDFDFGTFNFKSDSSMGFYILLIIIFILFAPKQNYFIKYKWVLLAYLSLTLLITNSSISIVILALIWILYLLKHFNFKAIFFITIILGLVVGGLYATGSLEIIFTKVIQNVQSNTNTNSSALSSYFSGGYGRGAALDYYLHSDILWFGNGPSKYYNVLDRISYLGNTGHLLTFYTEVGLIGWMLSIWLLFLISFPKIDGVRKFSWAGFVSFFAIQMLSVTTQVMNDISIMLAFCILSKIHIIPTNTSKHLS
jgi:hypothetical protein